MQTIDLAAMRAALKSNIAGTLTAFQVYDYEPKNPKYPCAIVSWPTDLNPMAAFGGVVDCVFPVRFQVIWNGDESSDQALMDAMEAAVNAIESAPTLSGNAGSVACQPFTEIGATTLPDDRAVMQFVIPVEVFA